MKLRHRLHLKKCLDPPEVDEKRQFSSHLKKGHMSHKKFESKMKECCKEFYDN